MARAAAPWVHADLARALVDAGFVVAMPEHRGDNYKDPSRRRPGELEAAAGRSLARHRRDRPRTPRFAPLLSLDHVGMYGMSAGGHTA